MAPWLEPAETPVSDPDATVELLVDHSLLGPSAARFAGMVFVGARAHLFDPSGRGEAFRQWVVVPPDRADEWESLAAEAVAQDHSSPSPAADALGFFACGPGKPGPYGWRS